MLEETVSGRSCQVTFGDPPEEYSLAVFRDRQKNELHWALYRGEGDTAMMVWDQPSNDPGFIHQLITAQFPGFDLKPVALRPTQDIAAPATESFAQGAANLHGQGDGQQSITGRMRGKPTFEGDLKNIQLPNILQSIAMSSGTGRLEVENVSESATIFFENGAPIHCFNNLSEGESAFVELIGWDKGEFRFYPGPKHDQQTIKRRLDTLLMEGSALDDQYQALRKWGANEAAFLWRTNATISDQDFDKALAKGTGADPEACKNMYKRIDDRTRLVEIVRRSGLPKSKWVPLLFNLSSCNLIAFNEQMPDNSSKNVAEAEIDWTQADNVERMLLRNDTNLVSYPVFLYFLRNEYVRWERFGRPFAVILLQLGAIAEGQGQAEPLSLNMVMEVGERISKLKRKTDIFGHYETFGFALLLLETNSQQAQAFGNRLVDSITTTPLGGGGMAGVRVVARAGVACIPDDCATLGSLLARAKPV
jgi:GGDEF domain-containing protein